MCKVKLNSMSYHARRILGQLCELPEGKGKILDNGDARYAAGLAKRGFISRAWFGSSLIAIVSKTGREAWSEFKNQGANP